MKSIVKKLAAILIILSFAATAQSFTKKDPNFANGNNPVGVTYVVEIDQTNLEYLCYTYIVVIRDEQGVAVGESRIYQEGISTYVFHENGPVSGTRSAHLERISSSCSTTCHTILYTPGVVLQNKFRNGRIYVFELKPSLTQTNY